MAGAGALLLAHLSVRLTAAASNKGPLAHNLPTAARRRALAVSRLRVAPPAEHLFNFRDVHLLVTNFLTRELLQRNAGVLA